MQKTREIFRQVLNHKYILMIFLLGCGLRFYGLDHKPIWSDELQDWYISQLSTFSQIELFARGYGQSSPWYFFNHFYIYFFGESTYALRFLPALFGSLAVLYLYFLGKKLFNNFVGLIASTFMAISYQMIWHSQDFRPYSLIIFLSVLSVSKLYDCLFKRENYKRNLILYTLVCLALSQIHIFGLFFIIFQNLFTFYTFATNKRISWPVLAPLAVTMLFSIPSISTFIYHFNRENPYHTSLYAGLVEYFVKYWKYHFPHSPSFILPLLAAIHIISPLLLCFRYLKEKESHQNLEKILCLTCWTFLPLILFWLPQFFINNAGFHIRHIIFCAPGLFLLTGAHFNYLFSFKYRKLVLIPLIATIGINSSLYEERIYNFDNRLRYEEAFDSLTSVIKNHDPLIISFTTWRAWYRLWRYFLWKIDSDIDIDVAFKLRHSEDIGFNADSYKTLQERLQKESPEYLVLLVREDQANIPKKLLNMIKKQYNKTQTYSSDKHRLHTYYFKKKKEKDR